MEVEKITHILGQNQILIGVISLILASIIVLLIVFNKKAPGKSVKDGEIFWDEMNTSKPKNAANKKKKEQQQKKTKTVPNTVQNAVEEKSSAKKQQQQEKPVSVTPATHADVQKPSSKVQESGKNKAKKQSNAPTKSAEKPTDVANISGEWTVAGGKKKQKPTTGKKEGGASDDTQSRVEEYVSKQSSFAVLSAYALESESANTQPEVKVESKTGKKNEPSNTQPEMKVESKVGKKNEPAADKKVATASKSAEPVKQSKADISEAVNDGVDAASAAGLGKIAAQAVNAAVDEPEEKSDGGKAKKKAKNKNKTVQEEEVPAPQVTQGVSHGAVGDHGVVRDKGATENRGAVGNQGALGDSVIEAVNGALSEEEVKVEEEEELKAETEFTAASSRSSKKKKSKNKNKNVDDAPVNADSSSSSSNQAVLSEPALEPLPVKPLISRDAPTAKTGSILPESQTKVEPLKESNNFNKSTNVLPSVVPSGDMRVDGGPDKIIPESAAKPVVFDELGDPPSTENTNIKKKKKARKDL